MHVPGHTSPGWMYGNGTHTSADEEQALMMMMMFASFCQWRLWAAFHRWWCSCRPPQLSVLLLVLVVELANSFARLTSARWLYIHYNILYMYVLSLGADCCRMSKLYSQIQSVSQSASDPRGWTRVEWLLVFVYIYINIHIHTSVIV